MNFRKLVLFILFSIFVLSCKKEEEKPDCDISDTAVRGYAMVNGETFCYDAGFINFNVNDNPVLSLNFTETTNHAMNIKFVVENGQIEFETTYTQFDVNETFYRQDDSNIWRFVSGSLTVDGSNYPNPSIYKYYGSFKLELSNDQNETLSVEGKFNYK